MPEGPERTPGSDASHALVVLAEGGARSREDLLKFLRTELKQQGYGVDKSGASHRWRHASRSTSRSAMRNVVGALICRWLTDQYELCSAEINDPRGWWWELDARESMALATDLEEQYGDGDVFERWLLKHPDTDLNITPATLPFR